MTSDEFKKSGKKIGALKRKLKIKANDKLQPGDMINRANNLKTKKLSAKEKLAIKGLV